MLLLLCYSNHLIQKFVYSDPKNYTKSRISADFVSGRFYTRGRIISLVYGHFYTEDALSSLRSRRLEVVSLLHSRF